MQKLTINRQNGNIPKSLAGQDHVSGLLFYVDAAQIPTAFADEPVQAVSTIDRAETLGITSDSTSWALKVLHFHLSEIFRVNDGVSLYVGIFPKPSSIKFTELKTMQAYAGGAIRQVGIWAGDTAAKQADITTLQGVAEALDADNAPLSVIYAPKVAKISNVDNLSGAAERVSVLIGQDMDGDAATLQADEANAEAKAAVTAIGTVLALVSKASVHESIAWVQKFNTGVSLPGFVDGTLLRDTDRATLEALDQKRLLFFVTYPGIAGAYLNDSHTMDSATSDYAMIENVRTMDKAVRGIRVYLTPELGGNIYVDAETGKLQPYTVKHLETTANQALEDMEKAGELSGYRVVIDPDQDVLKTSTIELLIKNVPVGVARRINVNIGFYKTV